MRALETPRAQQTTELLSREGGTLERRKGIYIAQLRGNYRQMGLQHAALAMESCGDVVSEYMNGLIEKMIAEVVPALARPVGGALKAFFHARNRARIGTPMLEHLGGLAEGAGMPARRIERSFLVPDILHYLAGRAFPGLAFPPMCSGFFATGPATRDGKVIIGRNFDFFGRGVWNTNNALIVTHPEHGQSYCWAGALGAPCSGQGFNESGLMLSLHTKFVRDVNTFGTPLFTLCHAVLAECETLEQALQRITSVPRLCGLTAFISDTRAHTAAAIGFSACNVEVVRPENGTLVRTNHYTTEPMRRFEVAPHPWQRNSRGRFQRVTSLLAEKRGALRPEDVPAILSDCVDPFEGCRRITGSIVAGANNCQSMVMCPEDDAVWFGHADYPVCHSEHFHGFKMSALFNATRDEYEIDDLAGAQQLDSAERAALGEYEQAWTEFLDHHNPDRAVFHLRRAAELLPEEVTLPRMAGLVLLKQRKYAQALPFLIRNTAHPYNDALMHAEAHCWVGRCLDLMGRRAEALEAYQKAVDLDVAPVSPAARGHLTKPFRVWNLIDVAPEFVVGTALARYN